MAELQQPQPQSLRTISPLEVLRTGEITEVNGTEISIDVKTSLKVTATQLQQQITGLKKHLLDIENDAVKTKQEIEEIEGILKTNFK